MDLKAKLRVLQPKWWQFVIVGFLLLLLGIRSYFVEDRFDRSYLDSPGNHLTQWGIVTAGAAIHIFYFSQQATNKNCFTVLAREALRPGQDWSHWTYESVRPGIYILPSETDGTLGFHFQHRTSGPKDVNSFGRSANGTPTVTIVGSVTSDLTSVSLSFWTMALFALFTAGLLWSRHARRMALKKIKGKRVCANCGYDLRATPKRCPECGVAASDVEVTAESQ